MGSVRIARQTDVLDIRPAHTAARVKAGRTNIPGEITRECRNRRRGLIGRRDYVIFVFSVPPIRDWWMATCLGNNCGPYSPTGDGWYAERKREFSLKISTRPNHTLHFESKTHSGRSVKCFHKAAVTVWMLCGRIAGVHIRSNKVRKR